MSRKMGELYNKAVKYHDEGNLDKAIVVCEKAMSENLKNAAILNLKGLIFYQKGELDEAITVWNINREFNDNDMSKSYIRDSISDREKILWYEEAEKLIKKLSIDRAIDILNKCAESDFNTINVNTALGLCYYKKGEPKKAKEYLNNALTVDRNYKPAKSLLKEINKVYKEDSSKSKKKAYILTFLAAVILGGSFATYKLISKDDAKAEFTSDKQIVQNEGKQDHLVEEKKGDITIKDNKEFNADKIQVALDNNDIYRLSAMIDGVDEKSLNDYDKNLYNTTIKKLKDEGVEKFYYKGLDYFNNKEYKKAIGEFSLALPYSKESYLNEHILYFAGITEQKLENNREATKYLEEYYNYYPNGTYKEEVLYKLAIVNEKDNIDKSKLYARILRDKYAKSMYNNKNIDKILDK